MIERIQGEECLPLVKVVGNHAAIMQSSNGGVHVRSGPGWLLCVPLGAPSVTHAAVGSAPTVATHFVAGTFGLLAPGERYESTSLTGAPAKFAVFSVPDSIDTIEIPKRIQGFHHDEALRGYMTARAVVPRGGTDSHFADVLNELRSLTIPAIQGVVKSVHSRADDIKHFVRSRMAGRVTIKTMAGHFGYSEGHFARWCRNEVGQSPHQLVVTIRLERAKLLLVETDWPVSDVALECGFYDQSHLTHAFRRYIRTSPSLFRRTNQALTGRNDAPSEHLLASVAH